jgi:16S rRNA (cytosine1402-N4)-methyltransferase
MRMNLEARKSAKDILNSYTSEELDRVFRIYGEVDESRKVADLVCRERKISPIETTGDLGRALESVLPKFSEHKFLAKIYQALRIETNDEMRDLEGLMKGVIRSLKSGGIVSVISYHSLEDRIVKNFLKSGNATGRIERDLMGHGSSPFELVNKKPIIPGEDEIAGNTRARSAKLRVAKRR